MKFNKLVSALTAAALCGTLCGALSASAEGDSVYGDLNGDGAVNSSDSLYVQAYYAYAMIGKLDAVPTWLKPAADADFNKDGAVDCADAVLILHYFARALIYPDMISFEAYAEQHNNFTLSDAEKKYYDDAIGSAKL